MGRDRLGCFNVSGVLAAAEPGAAPDWGRIAISRDNKLLQRPRQVSFGVSLCATRFANLMTPNAKLTAEVFAGLLLIGLGCLFHYRLSTLGWPGDWRSPSNREVTALSD